MDYSQQGEQKIIIDFFKDFKGSLLDIGANDGATLSNSRALMEHGWNGVLVEPAPEALRKLSELYKDNKKASVIPYGISNKSGVFKFYDSDSHLKNGDTSLLSTFKPEEIDRWKGTQKFEEKEIECITYDELLSLSDHIFDFITIDAEGLDFDILTQIDLTNTKMVCVETNSVEDQKYIDYCLKFGMKLHHKNYCNLIFVR